VSASSVTVMNPSAARRAISAASKTAVSSDAATSDKVRAASRNVWWTSGCRSSSVSTTSPNGVLWTLNITAVAWPNALLPIERACSSATGLRFCGMMLLTCTNPSPSLR